MLIHLITKLCMQFFLFYYLLYFNFCPFFCLEFLHRNFKVINDQPVKLEPKDQATSPYNNGYPGNYRDTSVGTPSPQPLSPPMFVQVSQSPTPYNNAGNILQNQLQAPRVTTNDFQQQPQANQIYTPNILTTAQFVNGNNPIWTNNHGNDPSTSRVFYNNMTGPTASAIFNQPQTPLPNITQNFNVSNEPMKFSSSNLLDMDSHYILDNLSGELQSLSFSDFAMGDSLPKTDERSGKRDK